MFPYLAIPHHPPSCTDRALAILAHPFVSSRKKDEVDDPFLDRPMHGDQTAGARLGRQCEVFAVSRIDSQFLRVGHTELQSPRQRWDSVGDDSALAPMRIESTSLLELDPCRALQSPRPGREEEPCVAKSPTDTPLSSRSQRPRAWSRVRAGTTSMRPRRLMRRTPAV